jgi:hypothetical protein
MKTIMFFAVSIVIVFSVPAFADFTANAAYTLNEDKRITTFGTSLDLEQKRIGNSINYSFGYYFMCNTNEFYTSAPGVFGVMLLFMDIDLNKDNEDDKKGNTDAIGGISLLFLIIPENIKFHFWMYPNFDLAIGLHPWDMIYDRSKKKAYYSNGISLDFNYIISSSFLISPYTIVRYDYGRYDHLVFCAGLRIGLSF